MIIMAISRHEQNNSTTVMSHENWVQNVMQNFNKASSTSIQLNMGPRSRLLHH